MGKSSYLKSYRSKVMYNYNVSKLLIYISTFQLLKFSCEPNFSEANINC